jgi:amino acid transporter
MSTMLQKVKRIVIGGPRDFMDPHLFRKISLIAFFAWVGLGADGLSSSSYGPDEAYQALGSHTEMAIFLALATAITVFVISFAYSRIIEHFPFGGGGFVVATKTLGPSFGVVSGCALLVDYVLTITVSVTSGMDQIFSFIPTQFHVWHDVRLAPVLVGLTIMTLLLLNLRGVKESIGLLMPIFLFFVVTHVVLLSGVLITRADHIPAVASKVAMDLHAGWKALGLGGLFIIFARGYARGAGTYTGIEAVSNGMPIMREPQVATGKRTMMYMALSLAVTAGGILVCYLLVGATAEPGKTMNAVLVERLGFGKWFVVLTLVAEAALLFVAAQTGFIDGPRVMSNMAVDSWLPRRFSALSERLTMHYGATLIALAAIGILILTRGRIETLVTMYSINVFITFSLSEIGMCRLSVNERSTDPKWKFNLSLHSVGLMMCLSILTLLIVEKFDQGGWVTVVITAALIGLCFLIHRYYRSVQQRLADLEVLTRALERQEVQAGARPGRVDPAKPTAVLLVNDYGGIGLHSLLMIFKLFPDVFKQVVFVSVGAIDSQSFKGGGQVERLRTSTEEVVDKYVALAQHMGLAAAGVTAVGTEVVSEAEKLCTQVATEYPHATFFAGKLIFAREKWYHRFLHNDTAFAVERRLQWQGLPFVVVPVRVFASGKRRGSEANVGTPPEAARH